MKTLNAFRNHIIYLFKALLITTALIAVLFSVFKYYSFVGHLVFEADLAFSTVQHNVPPVNIMHKADYLNESKLLHAYREKPVQIDVYALTANDLGMFSFQETMESIKPSSPIGRVLGVLETEDHSFQYWDSRTSYVKQRFDFKSENDPTDQLVSVIEKESKAAAPSSRKDLVISTFLWGTLTPIAIVLIFAILVTCPEILFMMFG